LYPAFPYEHFTHITRQDSDDLWAYLKSLPAISEPKPEHALRFPYNTQVALAVWRALYFQPAAPWQDQPNQSAQVNRGAYLVEGLGHCAACHSERNALGAVSKYAHLTGGLMNPQGWWAPSLRWGKGGGGASTLATSELSSERVRLLQTGVTAHKVLMGPMAQVVATSTQFIREPDLQAMVDYLQGLESQAAPREPFVKEEPALIAQGAQLYTDHCASCHGDQGQGQAGAYPALAGNRGVTLAHAGNTLKAIQNGGYAPSTPAHPRPYGMPPFRHQLSDEEIAAVATYIRQSWGNQASPVRGLALGQGQ
jgi:mono/diheme cytochrome c family protein